ncbi:hypothetical protein V6N13_069504 [Hibiscus sabdariffa]|uniref:ARM repeat superfamily protein n=1 Tax=Hibiscus sabdariffa TaxID=183260 RepID=A0ABR2PGE7_9ROSI
MVSTILDRLSRSSGIWDQIEAADLVACIAEHNPELKEYHLIRENVIPRLVTLLSSANDHWPSSLELQLKLSCSKALLMLVRRSLRNCTTFMATKGMICLAKLLETEKDRLHYNCILITREITAIADLDKGFRYSTFNGSSPAWKAVVDELLRIIKEYGNTKLRIPAIKSVGSLARSFPAKESQVISPLVARLGDMDRLALQKFFSSAKHDSNSNVLINAGALAALQTTGQAIAEEQPELEALVSGAISKPQSNKTEKYQVLDSSPGIGFYCQARYHYISLYE